MEFYSAQVSDYSAMAENILSSFPTHRIFLIKGEMGAGKTTFVKAMCQQLGVQQMVSSPTFSIVNEYIGNESTIYHFDLYRIKNQEELRQIGFEEYLYSGHYCFIEWPEIGENYLPSDVITISIKEIENYKRIISCLLLN